jgi:NADH dehydrogenase
MKVFLTGATGFVGSHMLPRLLQERHQVRALVRNRGALGQAGPIELPPAGLEEAEGDINAPDLPGKMAGCDAIINLVGIIYERGSGTFEAIHHQGTRNLVDAARQNGIKRFVQMSALGARPTHASAYHTTKFAAEEAVRNSGIAWTVLRPSLIFGPGSAFIDQMINVMRAMPLIRPVPGTGKYRFRPIYVDDVVECFTQSLTNPEATGKTVDLVGGEELTLNEIGDEIASCLRVRKRPLHVPIPVMKTAAAIFSVLPMQPPVTSVQIQMLQEGSTADPEPMKRIFHIEPVGFRKGLRSYLCDQNLSYG